MPPGESSWATIESDPGVFTELIEKIGVQGVQVEELWSLDRESLLQLSPVYGLVFLFKWEKTHNVRPREVALDAPPSLFFAQQVIPNACATQAILSILLNIPPDTPGVDLGTELAGLRDFSAALPADMKGLAISNSDLIRAVHNSMARPEALLPDEDSKQPEEGEAFHFIAYLPYQGVLYELDGLQPGPIRLAANVHSEAQWLDAVLPPIQERMALYAQGEVRFNLMALVADRRAVLQRQLSQLQEQQAALAAAEGEQSAGGLAKEIAHLKAQLASEHAKRTAWAEENVRRRHNFIPLMFNVLKTLASKKQLGEFINLARQPKQQQG